MAIHYCRECGHPVSDKAPGCPGCGAVWRPDPMKNLWVYGVMAVGVALSALAAFAPREVDPFDGLPPEVAARARADKAAQDVRAAAELERVNQTLLRVQAFRAVMHDPSSFALVKVGIKPAGDLCLTYRAKNKFGALVLEQRAMTPDNDVVSYESAHCQWGGYDDITHRLPGLR